MRKNKIIIAGSILGLNFMNLREGIDKAIKAGMD